MCDTVKAHFFQPIPLADLSNIHEFQNSATKPSPHLISLEEIAFALPKACPHKAPGPEGIPMCFLKFLSTPLLDYFKPLFQARFNFYYHPFISSNHPLLP
jgi:hypothetical protein